MCFWGPLAGVCWQPILCLEEKHQISWTIVYFALKLAVYKIHHLVDLKSTIFILTSLTPVLISTVGLSLVVIPPGQFSYNPSSISICSNWRHSQSYLLAVMKRTRTNSSKPSTYDLPLLSLHSHGLHTVAGLGILFLSPTADQHDSFASWGNIRKVKIG